MFQVSANDADMDAAALVAKVALSPVVIPADLVGDGGTWILRYQFRFGCDLLGCLRCALDNSKSD